MRETQNLSYEVFISIERALYLYLDNYDFIQQALETHLKTGFYYHHDYAQA